jgi:peptidoglycan/LPS O-acetylase OafA/YrhL
MPALDGLRGLAVLLVMSLHFLIFPEAGGRVGAWVARIVGTGWVGVDLFFVLSGFLITGILYRTISGVSMLGARFASSPSTTWRWPWLSWRLRCCCRPAAS